MNERHLFRGKRTDNGEWVTGYYLPRKYSFRQEEPLENVIGMLCGDSGLADQFHEIDPATLGQCTGLRDKNGRLIFEGDVLDTVALSNDHHQRGARYRGTVRYFAGSWCICEKQYEAGVAIFPFNVDHSIVVIGNVHDNSELLEAQP